MNWPPNLRQFWNFDDFGAIFFFFVSWDFSTSEEAARAFDAAAARRFHGPKAKTNFLVNEGCNITSNGGFVHNGNTRTVELSNPDRVSVLKVAQSSPLDLTLTPRRSFPVKYYHQQLQFSAAPSLGKPARFDN
ncbi:ethylene-responsive transcription factor 9-like [Forsythia ovata]|uniref:Ethylene-responsive transcription factor 9-like n=1 Tax=Forsythia ovata TaxID=205694 RepID=A0ABD1WXU2_9LAMI